MLIASHIKIKQVAFEQAALLEALWKEIVDLAMNSFIALFYFLRSNHLARICIDVDFLGDGLLE